MKGNEMSQIDFNEFFKLATNMSNNQESQSSSDSTLDKMTNNEDMRIIKAVLPYFDYTYQKQLSLIIKIMELKNTIDLFEHQEEEYMAELEGKSLDKLNILNDIKNSCSDENKKTLNMIITLLNLQKVTENFRSNPNLLAAENKENPINNPYPPSPNNNDNYDGFINMINKAINEKAGDKSGKIQ